jgi:hypothetical protein
MNVNPFDILKNAQELQRRMAEVQERLGAVRAIGSAGGGMVEVTMNGRLEPLAVKISPEALVPAPGGGLDAAFLGDLVLVAFRDAQAKAKEIIAKEYGNLPGIEGLAGAAGGA